MNDRAFYIAAAVAALLLIAFSMVWPQGEGSPSPAPFGHPKILPDYYRMVRERDARKAQDAQQKAAQEQRDAALQAAASSASSSVSADRAARQ